MMGANTCSGATAQSRTGSDGRIPNEWATTISLIPMSERGKAPYQKLGGLSGGSRFSDAAGTRLPKPVNRSFSTGSEKVQ